jgi:uncharacterized SAM-binding protein YcdF (DUF218 family)
MVEEPCPTCLRLRRRVLFAAAIVGVVAVVAMIGLFQFAGSIPKGVDDVSSRTDAIVVLTGGSERLTTGVDLLADGIANRVFVTGVHPSVDRESFLQLAGANGESLSTRIDTGHAANDTLGNARESALWMRENEYRSLRLVTSDYHMPRSLLEFRRAMPAATIIPHPVFSQSVKSGDWWRFPGTAMLIISEYVKFLVAWVSHHGTGEDVSPASSSS